MRQGVYLLHRYLAIIAALGLAFLSPLAQSQAQPETSPTACQRFNFTPLAKPPSAPSSRQPSAPVDATPMVVAQLRPGLLKPQIEALIKEGFAVTQVEWRASPHYRWSTDFELNAQSWQAALTTILRPYQLHLTLYANHTAVVSASAEVHP